MVGAPGPAPPRSPHNQGFSLVELVVVIVITGILASVVGLFISGPIQGFIDQSRRAELVDAALIAQTRLARDLRAALPNSVRINGNYLELLLTLDGERYRVEPPGGADDRLSFSADDTLFNTLAPLQLPSGSFPVTASVAIYPLQQTGANPYNAGDKVMTVAAAVNVSTVVNNGQSEGRVQLAAAHRFPFDSPTRRVFLVSGPVTYQCSPPQLLRYDGYAVSFAQPVPPGVAATVIAGNVESCVFSYDPGTAQRNAVVSVALSMAHPAAAAERVRLIRQIFVGNTP